MYYCIWNAYARSTTLGSRHTNIQVDLPIYSVYWCRHIGRVVHRAFSYRFYPYTFFIAHSRSPSVGSANIHRITVAYIGIFPLCDCTTTIHVGRPLYVFVLPLYVYIGTRFEQTPPQISFVCCCSTFIRVYWYTIHANPPQISFVCCLQYVLPFFFWILFTKPCTVMFMIKCI